MDTDSNSQPDKKNWNELVEEARSSQPPDHLDILVGLRHAIEAEERSTGDREQGDEWQWLDDIAGLLDFPWVKPALAVCGLFILFAGFQATLEWNEFVVAWELQIPGLTSLM